MAAQPALLFARQSLNHPVMRTSLGISNSSETTCQPRLHKNDRADASIAPEQANWRIVSQDFDFGVMKFRRTIRQFACSGAMLASGDSFL